MYKITICISEEHKRIVSMGFYSHENPRATLPKNVRLAQLSDLRNNKGPIIGTPFLFKTVNGYQYYATKLTRYGVDDDLFLAVLDKRVWVLKNTKS